MKAECINLHLEKRAFAILMGRIPDKDGKLRPRLPFLGAITTTLRKAIDAHKAVCDDPACNNPVGE